MSSHCYTQPIMPYQSLPKRLKQMIEDGVDSNTFEYEVKRPRYSDPVRRGARKYYKKENVDGSD